jgi:tetratricopeptide (TPR) repeat protein
MHITKKQWVVAGIGAVVLVIVGFVVWQSSQPKVQPFVIAMVGGEQVSSWDFDGAYTGNAELEAKAKADIKRLTGLLGGKQYSDYTLYVSIANQFGLLGDGKNELAYLERALAENATTTGLAWHNAGQLFARLGAYQTARSAFERAVAAQPIVQYRQALADFLIAHFPKDTEAIQKEVQAVNATGEASR